MAKPVRLRADHDAVVYYDMFGDRVEQDDGTWTPARFSYLEQMPNGGPRYLVECGHDSELRPQVEAVHVQRDPVGRELRNADLSRIHNLEDVVQQVWLAVSRRPAVIRANEDPLPPPADESAEAAEMRGTVRGLRQQARRKVTPELLAEVARIYRANEGSGAPVQAVREQLGVAESTAFRYVKLARESRDLAPRET
jgi:hypothetical protein